VGLLVIAAWQPGPVGGFPSVLLFIFWTVYLVGTANIYNFMDGINGMAGIAGACGLALLSWFIYSLVGASPYFYLTVGVALACLGFLPFNVPSARVFMGDIGSIFLGGLFGSLVYIHSRTLVEFLCMVSFLFPFYADALTSMVVRLINGENLTQPHRRHLYQILANEGGIAHWKISVAYGLFQLLVGVSVMGVKQMGLAAVMTTLLFWIILFLVTDRLVRKKFQIKSGKAAF
jgi:Fuc2NAc and GlcNAc transferase